MSQHVHMTTVMKDSACRHAIAAIAQGWGNNVSRLDAACSLAFRARFCHCDLVVSSLNDPLQHGVPNFCSLGSTILGAPALCARERLQMVVCA